MLPGPLNSSHDQLFMILGNLIRIGFDTRNDLFVCFYAFSVNPLLKKLIIFNKETVIFTNFLFPFKLSFLGTLG